VTVLSLGPRPTELPRSPFGRLVPSIVVAAVYAALTLTWIAAGAALPGGRWLALHLFTLGVLTNLVLVFSEHFARTVTRSPDARWVWGPLAANLAIPAVLVGVAVDHLVALAAGATALTAVVTLAYVRIRRMRKRSIGARFAWIARVYERAHGAFVHGAVLGLLLGIGVLPGTWFASARLAHLQVNVLGWGGLTLLATLVFFGPTIVRTRIEPGADARAARALKHGATALTVGVLALLASGVGGWPGVGLRWVGAAGIAVLAAAATVVLLPVARAALGAKPSATRAPVVAVCVWFGTALWLNAAVLASGRLRLLDALGLAALVGVLAQAMAMTLAYLAPMLRGRDHATRDVVLVRLARAATLRAVAFNVGTVLVVVAAALGPAAGNAGSVAARAGWALVAVPLVVQAVTTLWPLPRTEASPAG
jgi:hypothetical protein